MPAEESKKTDYQNAFLLEKKLSGL